MSSSHYKWLEETLGARQTGLGQRPATAGRRRRPVQGLTIGEAATIIQARTRLLRAQYKSVSVAGIGAAELRLHALLALQRSRRRRAEKARRAEGSDGGKLARLRAATAATQNARQKPAPLAKTLSSVRVGEEPDGALRFKGRVLSPPPKRVSARDGQLSPALIARLRQRMAPKLDRPRTAPARRPPSPRAAAADRLAAQAAIVKALGPPMRRPPAPVRVLTFNRSDPEPPPAQRDADKENAAPEQPEVAGKAGAAATGARSPCAC